MFVRVLVRSLILNFLITLGTELVVAIAWKLRKPRELLAVTLVNLITNPALTTIMALIRFSSIGLYTQWFLLLFEPLVFLIEGFLYQKALPELKSPDWFSLVANLSSVVSGYVIEALWYFLTT